MFDYIIFGTVEFLLGVAFTFFPPKKINDMYGYWGKSIRKSPEKWTLGHKILGPLFLIGGLASIFIGYELFVSSFESGRAISLLVSFATAAVSIVITEKKVKNLNS
jgi:uncharacterized membrane protein